MNEVSAKRPCWPLIWLWIFSISQYVYRYILQVNDSRTTHFYGPTPPAFSAIKYEILLLFAAYAIYRFWRVPITLDRQQRVLLWFTAIGLLLVGFILLVRSLLMPGDFDETGLCAMQFLPWVCSVFLAPAVINAGHSAGETLRVFERITFWILFPFWLLTVFLVAFDIRYPALSYPGVLLRFGGILDDPNGYACLCLLLAVLCGSYRSGLWKTRSVVYAVMLACTLSLTGYVTAGITILCLLSFGLWRVRTSLRWKVTAVASIALVGLSVAILIPSVYTTAEQVDSLTSLSSAKETSAEAHLSNLLPTEDMVNGPTFLESLIGVGGFSENFYWRVLANFGVTGLLGIVSLSLLWPIHALRRAQKTNTALAAWVVAVLFGSNGIAYLLTFPVSLLYWSILALLAFGETRTRQERPSSNAQARMATRKLVQASN